MGGKLNGWRDEGGSESMNGGGVVFMIIDQRGGDAKKKLRRN